MAAQNRSHAPFVGPFVGPQWACAELQGFVNNMEEWMHASDVIITKAGPGTIAESFICGLPVLLNGFIPGQEEGNIEYVLEHQVRLKRV